MAVKPAPAPGGKGRGKGVRAADTAVACWTPSCKAMVQPHWNTCLVCNTVRKGAWECNKCETDVGPAFKTCRTKNCTDTCTKGRQLYAEGTELDDRVLERARKGPQAQVFRQAELR